METQIKITRNATKGFDKAPPQVQVKFIDWIGSVRENGLEETRKLPGYHDELLMGQRKGQRSVRLNQKWRALYTVVDGKPVVVTVLEVNPHDYRRK